MDRRLKVLYYRGVKNTSLFFVKKSNKIKEFTYRGVSFIKNASEAKNHTSPKIYRGVAY